MEQVWYGVALVEFDGSGVPRLLAHALHSQVQMHEAYGGVVPELASRDHFFLCIEAADPKFDRHETGRFLRSLNPREVSDVAQ